MMQFCDRIMKRKTCLPQKLFNGEKLNNFTIYNFKPNISQFIQFPNGIMYYLHPV